MSTPLQGSLLDGFGDTEFGSLRDIRRATLDRGAWVDLLPGWLSGADALFDRLIECVPWKAERRPMYDRVVAVPRLLKFYEEHEPLPDPALADARTALSEHYQHELGEPFRTAGLCYQMSASAPGSSPVVKADVGGLPRARACFRWDAPAVRCIAATH
ncbi:hypothetical protein [Nocardia sp. R6R-6]|uniref:hypothetical protein n=1 Tax=Nocardia sp. R6R-6 TaxID=3459303 RepID=UPI00403D7625